MVLHCHTSKNTFNGKDFTEQKLLHMYMYLQNVNKYLLLPWKQVNKNTTAYREMTTVSGWNAHNSQEKNVNVHYKHSTVQETTI